MVLRTSLIFFSIFFLSLNSAYTASVGAHFKGKQEVGSAKIFLKINGEGQIKNLSDWKKQRQQIKFEIQDKIYGHLPLELTPNFKVLSTVKLNKIPARYREVEISFKNIERKIRLGIFLPLKKASSSLPVFLSLNKCGNHTIVDDEKIYNNTSLKRHPYFCKGAKRGSLASAYPVSQILNAGYAFATFDKTEMDADNAALKDDGIQALITTNPKDPNKSWGAIAAWATGLIKSVDYLITDPEVDGEKIIVTGHSRRGKAALLAGAMDERIAMVIPHQSGTGGTARFRHAKLRESAQMMTHGSPIYQHINEPNGLTHFFSKEFKKYSTNLDNLPVSAAHIIALVAPRPLLDTQGLYDFWAGPGSALTMVEWANPIWNLYGEVGIKTKSRLKNGEPINHETTGKLLQYCLPLRHVANESFWEVFIQFADLHLKA